MNVSLCNTIEAFEGASGVKWAYLGAEEVA